MKNSNVTQHHAHTRTLYQDGSFIFRTAVYITALVELGGGIRIRIQISTLVDTDLFSPWRHPDYIPIEYAVSEDANLLYVRGSESGAQSSYPRLTSRGVY